MLRRSFFNLGVRPKLRYPVLSSGEATGLKEIPLPPKAVLMYTGRGGPGIKTGDKVRTGQRLGSGGEGEELLLSPVTGKVTTVSPYKDSRGNTCTAVSVDVAADEWDEGFQDLLKNEDVKGWIPFLSSLPGKPSFESFSKTDSPVHTWVISALDKDILISTSQFLLHTRPDEVRDGIERLRKLIGQARVVMVVPPELASLAEKTGAEVKVIDPVYPNAHPKLLARAVLERKKGLDEAGVGFIGVEAIIALNTVLGKRQFPVNKVFTVTGKDLKPVHVQARIGTPVKEVLDGLNMKTDHGDRVILGGPMSGETIYMEETPILADTDGILVQGKEQIQECSDTHCINCGECVRICPSRVQVNMLIRFLENGLYQEAADLYDLMHCIDCGLCGYVCTSRIPLFQYIRLGKHELARKKAAEVTNG